MQCKACKFSTARRRLSLRYVCFLLLIYLFACYNAKAVDVVQSATAILSSNIFADVAAAPPAKRLDRATSIYEAHCLKMPPALAMRTLDQLDSLAIKLRDKPLQCAVLWLKADYYAQTTGFNTKSAGYYHDAAAFAGENELRLEHAVSWHKAGLYFHHFKRNTEAFQYLLEAQDIFSEIGFDKVPDINTYLSELIGFYYSIGDYYNARLQIIEALKYKPRRERTEISLINTLGLIERKFRQYPQALSYFNRSLKLAIAYKDSAWVGIATGNIGSVYLLRGEYKKALPCLRLDYKLSLKYNERVNGAAAVLRMARVSLLEKNTGLAAKQLDTANLLMAGQPDITDQQVDYFELKAMVFESRGDLADALAYRKKFEAASDSLAKKDNVDAFERMRLRLLKVKHRAQVHKLRTDKAVGYVRRNAVIAVLFLVTVIFGLIYNRQLLKQRKDRELLAAEKRRVDEELRNSELELQLYTERLRQNNEVIERFKERIENLQENKDQDELLERLMQVNIMTDENWNEFKRMFVKVHSGFFFDLKKKHPNISGTDTRLLALMKLELSNREMANMLGITVEGIKKAKQRLRKKMGLPAEEVVAETA